MALETAQAAHRVAQSIISESRFHTSQVPDPLHGLLVSIGRAISDPLGALGRLIGGLGTGLTGGVTGVWVAVAVAVLLTTGGITLRQARRRLERSPTGWRQGTTPPKPAQLEQAAEQAERDGDWGQAFRLRFQAGLLRLGDREGPRLTESTPNHRLARRLGSDELEALAVRFDEIVYGNDVATAIDSERQRRAWPEILAGERAGGERAAGEQS